MISGNTIAQIVGSTAVSIAIGLAGYVYTSQNALAQRVTALEVNNAQYEQETTDIDTRLTRIENELDQDIASRDSSNGTELSSNN